MSRSLEDLLEFDYFPYYTKEELLEKVKTWIHPESAAEYVRTNYDRSSKMRKRSEELFKSGKSFNEISKIMDEEFPAGSEVMTEGIPSTHDSGNDKKIRVETEPTFVGAKKRLFKKQKSMKGPNFTPPKKKRK